MTKFHNMVNTSAQEEQQIYKRTSFQTVGERAVPASIFY